MRISTREYQGSLPERASSNLTHPTTLFEKEGGLGQNLENNERKKTQNIAHQLFSSKKTTKHLAINLLVD